MMPPFLIADELYLRPLLPEDADGPYLSWFNDEVICQGNSHHVFPYTYQAAQAYINQAQAFEFQLVLAVILKDGHRHIGNAALLQIDLISRSSEFAIVIGEMDCWGKGYSKQVTRLIFDHAFFTLNLNRLYCGTFETNIAMQRLAKYLGMEEEGRRRNAAFKNNEYLDIIEYGLLREEYIYKFGTPETQD
jgi:[ribosomal protein S5]-alanine N-acetyltransferase